MRAVEYFILLFFLVMGPLLVVGSARDWISTASLITSIAFIYSLIRNNGELAMPAFGWFTIFYLLGLGSVGMGPIINSMKHPNSAYNLSQMFQDSSHQWSPIIQVEWLNNFLHNDVTLLVSWVLQMVVLLLFFFKLFTTKK